MYELQGMIIFAILILISAESIANDHFKYRKAVKILIIILFIIETSSYLFRLYNKLFIERLLHRIVELIYILLNCSICYNMNEFLGNKYSLLSIYYTSMILIIIYIFVPLEKYHFGRLKYVHK